MYYVWFLLVCLQDMTDRKDNLSVYQTRIFPPHFNVVIEDTVWNLKPVSVSFFSVLMYLTVTVDVDRNRCLEFRPKPKLHRLNGTKN